MAIVKAQIRHCRLRKRNPVRKFRKFRADCRELDSKEFAQEHGCGSSYEKRDESTRYPFATEAVPQDDCREAADAESRLRPVYITDVLKITDPFRDESGRHRDIRESEEILHLRREYSEGYTAGEADDDRVRYEMEYGSEPAESHHHQNHSGHNRGDREPGHPVLSDDAGDNDDERARGASDEEARTAEDRNQESRHYCRDEPLLRSHAAGDSECDCEREGDDTDDDSRDEIGDKPLLAVPSFLKKMKEFRTEYPCVLH